MQKYIAKHLEWDTNFWGVKSARIDFLSEIYEGDYEGILDFCKSYTFVTLVNKGNLCSVNDFIGKHSTAQLKDINVSFCKRLEDTIAISNEQIGEISISNNYEKNEKLLDIASDSFVYSRFFNDLNLEREKSKKVYVQWVESSFNKEHKYFLVYGEKNPKGFIVFSLNEQHCSIELVAVSAEYQGQRIGTKMLQFLEVFCRNRTVRTMSVGTQSTNVPAVQFYTKCGFVYQGNSAVYHFWMEDEK